MCAGYGNGQGRQENGLQESKLAHRVACRQVWQARRVGRHSAPLAALAGQAVRGPASLFALDAFGVAGQVAFLEVMGIAGTRVTQSLGRVEGGLFDTVRNGEFLARIVDKVVAD